MSKVQIIKNIGIKKEFLLKSQGKSMQPVLNPDDVLYFKKISFTKIKLNDIVLVFKNNTPFAHRVIYKSKKYIITKGDNNPRSDGKVYPPQIIGKVYQIKRSGQIISLENLYLIQSTFYFNEIIKIKKLFEQNNINFVFLKGLPLHLYFEKSHPRRIYADCDVLIASIDYRKAERILKQQGFKKHDTSLTPLFGKLKDKLTEATFVKKGSDLNIRQGLTPGIPIVFDVHLEPVFLMNQLGKLNALYPEKLLKKVTTDFLTNKQYITVQHQKFPILSNENLIIYLSLHFFHHNFQGIYRLDFLDRVIKKTLLDVPPRRWQDDSFEVFSSLLDIARRINYYRLENFTYPVFLLLKKYYQTKLPNSFLKLIQPDISKLNYIKQNIMTINIFDDESRLSAGINRFKKIFYLSPEPMYQKIMVIFNPAVVNAVFWVLMKKIRQIMNWKNFKHPLTKNH